MRLSNFRPTIGIAWYLPEDYPLIVEIMENAQQFPPSFDAWLYFAEKLEIKLLNCGLPVVRVPIEPAAFIVWGAAHGLQADAASLDLLVSEYAFWQIAPTHDCSSEDEPLRLFCFDYIEREAVAPESLRSHL